MSVSAPAKLSVVLCAAVIAVTAASVVMYTPSHPFEVPDGLPEFTVSGETDLEGNFYLSFVYTKNIIMLDGKGNIVWAKHVDQGDYQNTLKTTTPLRRVPQEPACSSTAYL